MPIEPARLSVRADGTPFSERYGDVYHSSSGGPEQSRHVFLHGNDLPGRWQGRQAFTIVETGFGTGLNFLTTWAAWRDDPQRCARLHFVSTELHPFDRDALARLHGRWPALAPLGDALRERWPPLTPGFHRLELDAGRVVLTLLLGDAAELLPEVVGGADAFYLDGFAPGRNPDLWSPPLLASLGRSARPGATLATWSVAAAVREGLAQAGFACRKVPGFGAKREMLVGAHAGSADAPAATRVERRALVIGAGLAGSSVAHRLAERGWQLDVIDAASGPGEGASGNLAGVLRPLPSLDDNRLARLTRAGALYGFAHLHRLTEIGLPIRWDACGVLHLARDRRHEARQRETVLAHAYPPEYLRFVESDEAGRLAGWPVPLGGWWFPSGAWVNPPSLCAAQLAAWPTRTRCHFGRALARLVPLAGGGWAALDATGAEIAAAPVAILANGIGIRDVPEAAALPVRSARGQVSHLPAAPGDAPQVVVCRLGYASPPIDGVRSVGASFSVRDDDPLLRESDHRDNLAKLDFILPGQGARMGNAPVAGRVGFRPASPDRLPIVGAVPICTAPQRDVPLAAIARHPRLYAVSGFGARGLVWAASMGELLASELEGEPLPLERELVEAVDPARFLVRPGRRTRAPET